ncbi:hypothetical protein BDA99DRAFT_534132 [Phascolomyces articulosus]|uniref:Uncharacterized protein n=1 Tax=Phascolomyces articulosus TaxID=60185 RepID=A0AAD5PIL7_9FUNG|nr:hypothetical protein BDA99DRAFT_534132 [Phascolomyces articulosus]
MHDFLTKEFKKVYFLPFSFALNVFLCSFIHIQTLLNDPKDLMPLIGFRCVRVSFEKKIYFRIKRNGGGYNPPLINGLLNLIATFCLYLHQLFEYFTRYKNMMFNETLTKLGIFTHIFALYLVYVILCKYQKIGEAFMESLCALKNNRIFR